MVPERWRKIEELFHAASARDAGSRPGFLERACGADGDLRREVESLLGREAEAAGFLEPARAAIEPRQPARPARYRILERVGTGGMGEVYRAEDTKLGREVALKTLRRDFDFEPGALTRFEREARLLAALNHPNVATIYEIEEWEEGMCLVLELVEGRNLCGPLPVQQAIGYARQVAEALEAAHGQGIIHCDLKPANVKVTARDRVKVLDFGLATALGARGQEEIRAEPGRTEEAGVPIGGTPPYMSPEQACGGLLDQRTDIWAFGCLLYELLSGNRAFGGSTHAESLEQVQSGEPDWTLLPEKTPRAVRELIRHCLVKDASRRLADIGEARRVLERLERKTLIPGVVLAASGAVIFLVAALAGWRLHSPGREPLQVQLLTTYPGAELFPALSPDGQSVAFTWTGGHQDGQVDLYSRRLNGETPIRMTNDAAQECYTAWSPDGTRIAFLHCDGTMGGIRSDAEVHTIAASGGHKERVGKVSLQAYDNVPSLAWMPDGRRLVVRHRERPQDGVALFSLEIGTGVMRRLTSPPIHLFDASPAVSPDGQWLAFVRQTTTSRGDIFIQDLAGTKQPRQLTHEGRRMMGLAWRSSRELIYLTEDGAKRSLWRIGGDGSGREVLNGTGLLGMQFSLSSDGHSLVYSDAYIDTDIARVSVQKGRNKRPLRAETLIASTQWDGSPSYSPDGKRIAFVSARSGQLEIWVGDADGSNPAQLTFWNRNTGTPRWSPSGEELAADSQAGEHTDIYVIDVRSRHARKLTGAGQNFLPSWSRDGKSIYFVSDREDGYQVWKVPATRAEGADAGWKIAKRITRSGGFTGAESWDGKRFYYAKRSGPSCVWSVPADGGTESEVICPLLSWNYLAMFADGFFYAARTSSEIWFYSLSERQAREAFHLQSGAGGTFAFSPDRKWLLVTRAELRGDLYLAANLN